jgi:hypothetical protein
VDLDPEQTAPVLIDFRGGRRGDYRLPSGLVRDEAAAELLVLRPDGTLGLLNGRDDTDPQAPAGHERLERAEAWRQRLLESRVGPVMKGGLNPFGGKN